MPAAPLLPPRDRPTPRGHLVRRSTWTVTVYGNLATCELQELIRDRVETDADATATGLEGELLACAGRQRLDERPRLSGAAQDRQRGRRGRTSAALRGALRPGPTARDVRASRSLLARPFSIRANSTPSSRGGKRRRRWFREPATVEPATREIARRAAELGAMHGNRFRLPDALVVATPVDLGADLVLTTDARWPAVPVSVEVIGSPGGMEPD